MLNKKEKKDAKKKKSGDKKNKDTKKNAVKNKAKNQESGSKPAPASQSLTKLDDLPTLGGKKPASAVKVKDPDEFDFDDLEDDSE